MAADTLAAVLAEIKANPGKFYVYILSKPDGTPFYVGKGVRDRIAEHGRQSKKGQRSHKCAAIRKIWRSGDDVIYRIDSFHDEDAGAFGREIELIESIGRLDQGRGPLVNGTSGGDGLNNPSQALRDRQREIKAIFYADPKNRAAVAERTKRQFSTPEARAVLSERAKTRLSNPVAREAMRRATIEARRKDPTICQEHSRRMREKFADPEEREKLSQSWTPEKRREASERRKLVLANPEAKRKNAERLREMSGDPGRRAQISTRVAEHYVRNPDARTAQSVRTKAFFAQPGELEAARERSLKLQADKRVVIERCKGLMTRCANVAPLPSGRAAIVVWLQWEADVMGMACIGEAAE